MKKLISIAAIVVVASMCVVTAQEAQPTLKPSVSPKEVPVRMRFLLEVAYNRALPPMYAAVHGVDEKPNWIWLTTFARIPGRVNALPPVQAVRIESVYNGETADVKVTLLRGAKNFDQEQLVGVYQVGIGEQKILGDLDQFGIEPFTISLLNTPPPVPPQPTIDNRTKSIEVASIQLENMPHTGYRVVLRNLSDKNVGAVRVQVMSDGMRGPNALWQGENGQSLIKPGGTVERYIQVMKPVKTPTGYAPGAPVVATLILAGAVFENLSFEGEAEPACLFESFQMGRKIWLTQAVPLLDQELSKSIPDHIEAAKRFKERFLALRYGVEASELEKTSSVAPSCAKPAQNASISVENMKLELLRELDEIITTRPLPPVNFKSWLQKKRALFSAWLERL